MFFAGDTPLHNRIEYLSTATLQGRNSTKNTIDEWVEFLRQ